MSDALVTCPGLRGHSSRDTRQAPRGVQTCAFILFVAALALLLYASSAPAQADLPESYDENTELTVRGSVVETARETAGPLVIKLRHRNKLYHIFTAPPWYLLREQIVLREGLELEVTGSKYLTRDGRLLLMARQIRDLSTGKVTVLRDARCRPLWHGHRMHRGRSQ